MQPTLCSRCHKNVAVIFITKLEGGETKNEGLCLKCARELGIKPIDDMMKKMGISDEDLDNLTNEMMSAFGGAEGMEGLMAQPSGQDDEEDDGRTATFPFLNQLFGGGGTPAQQPGPGGEQSRGEKAPQNGKERPPKRKFLESYCISLTKRAQEGKLDKLIGRDRELERVSSASPAWARPPSPRGWPCGLPRGTSPISWRIRRSISWTSPPWWRAPSSGASSRAG